MNAGGGLGDARLVPKVNIFDLGTDTFWYALGAAVPVTFPTGKGTALRGSESTSFEPRLLFAIGGGRWDATFNAGYLMRTADKSLAGRTEVTFGGAFSYGIVQGKTGVDLQVEVYGAHLPDAQTSGSKTPVESLVGAVIWPSEDLGVYLGAGPGISAGLGSPDFRVAAGVRFGKRVPRRDRHGDRDHDGVDNLHDQCPDAQEDQDGFQDNDGCPDPDNDGDGVLDERDECPEAAEEPGGNGDGCPAKGRVIVEDGQMHVFGKVQFDTGSANIAGKSEPLLDDLAGVLKAHPEFKKVEIGGHTDDTGPKEVNDKLSKERAEAVKKALIKRGISADRLETVGYGPSKPVSSNATAVGRARNRRVEFTVKE
ncbi:MAG: OmpA family protein [Deltaproteobacteria bacterium]|nr:OmpA family protein [Deltaproteobacteria bacterium]